MDAELPAQNPEAESAAESEKEPASSEDATEPEAPVIPPVPVEDSPPKTEDNLETGADRPPEKADDRTEVEEEVRTEVVEEEVGTEAEDEVVQEDPRMDVSETEDPVVEEPREDDAEEVASPKILITEMESDDKEGEEADGDNEAVSGEVTECEESEETPERASLMEQLEKELNFARESASKAREKCEAYRRQKDSALEERNALVDMVSRLNSEMVYLKDLQAKSSTRLKNVTDSNFEILAKTEELKTKEASLTLREELLEQERAIADETIGSLTAELNKKNLELDNLKIAQSSKIASLEVSLAGKKEELAIADRDISHLRSERLTLVAEVLNLNKKLDEQRDVESKTCDELRKKLNAKTKVADLYKSMRDDSNAKCEELVRGVTELQRVLNEAVEKYGDLESKNLQMESDHEAALRQKSSTIDQLKEDLESAKRELAAAKSEKISIAMKDLSPSAAIAREFVRSGMSLSEIYSRLINVSDELENKTNENLQLKEAFNAILEELEDNAPFIKSQISQNQNILEDHSVVVQQLESVEMEYDRLREDYTEAVKLSNHFERENKRIKEEMSDLSRQVCFLLKEIEYGRGSNYYPEKDVANGMSSERGASQIISKNLVTFADIQELQANNQKLLKLVKDLAEKQEENEALREQYEIGELQAKLNELNEKIAELTNHNERQAKNVNNLIKQRDMYKKLMNQGKNKSTDGDVSEDNVDNDDNMDGTFRNKEEDKSHFDESMKKVKVLESEIEECKKRLKQQEEDYKKYETLTDSKEKNLLDQIEKLKKELFDVNETYRKCAGLAETNSVKCKMLQSDLAAHKKKNASLEGRIEKSNTKLAECETRIKYLHEKISRNESTLTENETTIKSLRKECAMWRETKDKLFMKCQALNEELKNRTSLITNFEAIKKIIEDKRREDKSKLETKLDEFTRECSLLRRKIQEKDAFSDTLSPPSSKLEKADYEKLKIELAFANEELQIKTQQIKELSETLASGDGKYLKDEIKNLQRSVDEKQLEVDSLTKQLADNKEYMKQITLISENAEKELKKLNDEYTVYKNNAESTSVQHNSLIERLREKMSELEAELSLQNTNQDEVINHMRDQLNHAEENINALSLQLSEKTTSLDENINEIFKLKERLDILNEENINLNITHSESVQKISQQRTEIMSLNNQIMEITAKKVEVEETLNDCIASWKNKCTLLDSEKEQVELQLTELKHQNVLLHDQIEMINSQFILSQSVRNESHNESLGENTSMVCDSDTKSHLLQIIKYLRKERDLHSRKLDEIREENIKMKSELEILQNELTTVKDSQIKNVDNSQADISSASHSELIDKIEMLNELTVSNTLLRDERDKLLASVEKSSQRMKELEDSVTQLQSNNENLSKRINSIIIEKNCISSECNRWKSKVSSLIEKTNKTSPEDWKRLQNERETLAKMLTAEKESTKKVRDELTLAKIEKNRIEEQMATMSGQLANVNELRNSINQLTTELNDTKSALKEKTEEITRLNENLSISNSNLTEIRSKELQIKKIARQYKSQYDTLLQSVEEEKKKSEQNAAESSASTSKSDTQKELEQKVLELEKTISERTTELEAQVTSSLEENDSLQKEIETLKTRNEDIEEKAKLAIKQAKAKIFVLSESKDDLTKKLEEAKVKLENFEQNKDEHDMKLAALKSQYEGRLNKLEKDRAQSMQAQQNENVQLNKQIESLQQRIAQMQKQLDSQSAKPSTSSNQGEKSNVEPPTANIKPMAGAQTSSSTRRIGSETPLASIKPMTSVPAVRTAAVLPTTASSHQSPHTTGNTMGEVISSSPSSSHATEYLPSSSSTNRHHLLHSQNAHMQSTPMHSVPPESTQDSEMDASLKSETSTINNTVTGFQQTVALVSPRMETLPSENITQPTSSSNSGSHSTVTTSHTNMTDRSDENTDNGTLTNKRIREDFQEDNPTSKRTKVEVSKSNEYEAEYQVPTSSQKDQEDDSVIVVDSEDEEGDYNQQNMYEENDDEDDDEDDVEEEEEEEDDSDEDEDVDEEVMPEDEEEDGIEAEEGEGEEYQNMEEEEEIEEELDDDDVEISSKEHKTSTQSNVELVDDTSQEGDDDKENDPRVSFDKTTSRTFTTNEPPQNTSRGHSSQGSFLTIRPSGSGIHQNVPSGSYEEGDDSIVPSTPTLFVPTRNDGFGEAVRSPTVDTRGSGRFSFNSNNSGGVLENTHADLTPQLSSRQNEGEPSSNQGQRGDGENFDSIEGNEAARNLEASFS